jgi:hypothetical protein
VSGTVWITLLNAIGVKGRQGDGRQETAKQRSEPEHELPVTSYVTLNPCHLTLFSYSKFMEASRAMESAPWLTSPAEAGIGGPMNTLRTLHRYSWWWLLRAEPRG